MNGQWRYKDKAFWLYEKVLPLYEKGKNVVPNLVPIGFCRNESGKLDQ